jgi:hypothetical protein
VSKMMTRFLSVSDTDSGVSEVIGFQVSSQIGLGASGEIPLSARPAKNARLQKRPGAAKPQREKKQVVAAIAHRDGVYRDPEGAASRDRNPRPTEQWGEDGRPRSGRSGEGA